ncbi:MAG: RNA-binding S4 domain-containing protein [Tannerella sp.]|nr:RNA-binding S4 domain-containing protein [Tannerella sp.]
MDDNNQENQYQSEGGGGYQRRSYNQNNEQGGYQQRSYGSQGGGYQQRRSYDNNQEGGYQQRRSYDNNQGGGYQQRRSYDNNQGGGYQQRRSYDNNQEGGYQQRRSYDNNQEGGYRQRRSYDNNQEGGYQQRRSYDNQQEGGYQQKRNYNNQGSNRQGGYQQRGYNQGGGYNQRGGYNQGGYQQRRPGGGSNMRRPQQGGYNSFSKPSSPRPIKYQEVITDPTAPIRLNKYLANAGVCSRREADEFIQSGVVKVNGDVVTELGTKITRVDKVTFHDQPVQIESKVYILLNKPKNCVTTSDDPQNRQTVMDLVKNACQERIYPVGRLDRNTTGVLLLTNDGEMAAKLTHPSYKKKKIYHVWLDHEVTVEDMEKLANGIELEDGEIHADAISYANEEDRSQVGIEIHSGKNRIVRRMFEMLGYHVTKLDRVYFAGLTKRNLGRGKWRYLTEQEVNALRMGAYE